MSNRRPLHEYSADDILGWLEKSHEALLDAEEEHARAKALFEGYQGTVMEFIKNQGKPVEIAKKMMWADPRLVKAHDDYLEVWRKFQAAKNQKERIDDALRLWQTVRADVRKV